MGENRAGKIGEWLHEQPRWDGKFHPAPNSIPPNFETSEGKTESYIEGITMVAAAVVAVGCVFFVANLAMYVMAWRCGWWGPRAQGGEVDGAKLRRRSAVSCLFLWCCTILFLMAIVVSWVGTVEFGKGASGTFEAMDDLSGVLHKSEEQMKRTKRRTEFVEHDAHRLAFNLTKLSVKHNASALLVPLVNDSRLIESSSAAISTTMKEMESTMHVLHSGIDDVTVWTTQVHHFQNALNWSALGVGLLLGIVLILSTLRCGGCAIVHKATASLTIPISLLLWFFAAFVLVLGFFLSDFCVAPDGTGVRLVRGLSSEDNGDGDSGGGAFGNKTLMVGSAVFYLHNCSKSNDPTNDGVVALPDAKGLYGSASVSALGLDAIARASAELATNISNLSPLIRPLDPAGFDQVLWDATNMSVSAQAANLSGWNVLPTIDCPKVRHPWEETIDAVCDVGVEMGFLPLWSGSTGAAVFLTLALLLGVPLCGYHPTEAGGSIADNLLQPAEAARRPRPGGRERAIPDEYGTVSEANPVAPGYVRAHAESITSSPSGSIEIPEWGGALGAAAPSREVSVSSWAAQQSEREARVAKASKGKVRERRE